MRNEGFGRHITLAKTGLTKPEYARCTRDIWIKEKKLNDLKERVALALFLHSKINKKAIGEVLGVSECFVKRSIANLADLEKYPNIEKGFERKEMVTYISLKKLAERLDFSVSSVHRILRELGVPPESFVVRNGQTLTRLDFYCYRRILELKPAFRERISWLKGLKFAPDYDVLKKKPKDLSKNQYKVLYTLIFLRNNFDYWPSVTEVAYATGFSYDYVRKTLAILCDKKYLGVIRNRLNPRKKEGYKVFKGPRALLETDYECSHCVKSLLVKKIMSGKRG